MEQKTFFKRMVVSEINMSGTGTGEFSFGLRYAGAIRKKNKNLFAILFDVSVNNDNDFSLTIKALAEFETDFEVDEAFVDSPFVRINAPAIAFPYLRTFISNLTLNAGLQPIILPTVNFTKREPDKDIGEESRQESTSSKKKRTGK